MGHLRFSNFIKFFFGVYFFQVHQSSNIVPVFCDSRTEGGRWLVSRGDKMAWWISSADGTIRRIVSEPLRQSFGGILKTSMRFERSRRTKVELA